MIVLDTHTWVWWVHTEVMRRVAERYERAELPAAQGLHPSPRAGS
jgi:PIN domain nuclease of toxin-antitoxin system